MTSLSKSLGKVSGFTLLELLVVLIIVSLMLYITYPIIRRNIIYGNKNPNLTKTILLLKYLMSKRFSKFKNKDIFVRFDIKDNYIKIYYKKADRLIPFKKLKLYKIRYNSLRMKEIKSGGKTISRGSYYILISPDYISAPFTIIFSESGVIKKLFINTYINRAKTS